MSDNVIGLIEAARRSNNATALTFAVQNGHIEIVQTLLGHGADVNARAINGMTVLISAAMNSYKEIVKILLTYGAEVNAKGKMYGKEWTALTKVIESKENMDQQDFKKIVELLLTYGAEKGMI